MKDLNTHLPDPAATESHIGVDRAMQSLADTISAIPREEPPRKSAPGKKKRRAATLITATAVCALAALIGVTRLVGGDGTGSAWATADIAIAQQTPLVLLTAPGYKVWKFDQYKAKNTTGEIIYKNSSTGASAYLNWDSSSHLKSWRRRLSSRAVQVPSVTLDGHRVEIYREHSEAVPMDTGYSAIWLSGKYTVMFMSGFHGTPSKLEDERFAKLLGQLKYGTPDELLASLPKNYLLPSRLAAVATKILADVPKPDGFSAAPLLTNLQGSSQHSLAYRLIINVQCGWIHDWVAARDKGDKAEMTRIADVLAPYKTWRYAGFKPPAGSPFHEKVYVGQIYIEALEHGGRAHFAPGDTRDIGKIYKSWMGCELL